VPNFGHWHQLLQTIEELEVDKAKQSRLPKAAAKSGESDCRDCDTQYCLMINLGRLLSTPTPEDLLLGTKRLLRCLIIYSFAAVKNS